MAKEYLVIFMPLTPLVPELSSLWTSVVCVPYITHCLVSARLSFLACFPNYVDVVVPFLETFAFYVRCCHCIETNFVARV